ncbi:arginine--tRNA ligase [Candidatus Parcubacteria bacterium]|nr:arginine--tRNA ligase [Candidatus Parcubacteria bacterium]
MDIQTKIKTGIQNALSTFGMSAPEIVLEHPADPSYGDFATSIALALAKEAKSNPRDLAAKIADALRKEHIESVAEITVAGPGFINFRLSESFYIKQLETILKRKDLYGNSNEWRGRKVLVEYTDPNPFKEFHIGHLMSNAIGESISRLIASQGAKVRRMCYQGDFGIHVAKTLWAALKNQETMPSKRALLSERIAFLGACYVEASKAYETDPEAKKAIEDLNKKVFEAKDRKLMKLYKLGRKWSLQHFEEIYEKLDTKFDYYMLESEVAHDGVALVEEYLEKGIFEKSDGAIVFKGEKYDPKLHTRVFINSQGIPTYEAKELGLNTKKWKKVRPDESIIITANEQSDYFRVVLKALELVEPEAARVTKHVSHGMLRFAEGKMSSRKGNVITGESLIHDVEKLALGKLASREMDESQKKDAALMIAVAAIKYSILKQVTSSDIVYDFDRSISFEGDSGPYLLYTAVRAESVLEKAKKEGVKAKMDKKPEIVGRLERMLARFPEVVSRAANEKAPHHAATYLVELSSLFNSWYANVPIVNKEDADSPYKVALTQAVRTVLVNGLKLLGMKVPERM